MISRTIWGGSRYPMKNGGDSTRTAKLCSAVGLTNVGKILSKRRGELKVKREGSKRTGQRDVCLRTWENTRQKRYHDDEE